MYLADAATFGFALPQLFIDGRVDSERLKEAARLSERLGYSAVWVQEASISSVPMPHPLQVLPYVAAVTEHVRLGVAVLVLSRHNPAELAWQIAALDQLSGGRVVVGVGIGGQYDELPGLGMGRTQPIKQFVESLEVMKALWRQDAVGYDGDIWHVGLERISPGPLQLPHPHLVIAGRHPDAIRRAVALGDGWVGAGASSLQAFIQQYAVVQAELVRQGRDARKFSIAKRVYVALDENAERARSRLRESLTTIYGDPGLCDRVGVYGGRDRCRQYLEELVAAGARHVILNPLFDELEQLRGLSEVVGLSAR